jgi:hypothetical protein
MEIYGAHGRVTDENIVATAHVFCIPANHFF